MSKVLHELSRILVNRLCLMTKTDEFVNMRFNTIKEWNRIIKCENNNNN